MIVHADCLGSRTATPHTLANAYLHCYCFYLAMTMTMPSWMLLRLTVCRAEHDGVHVGCMGGGMSTVGAGSQRLKEVTIHAGPVGAIAIHAGAPPLSRTWVLVHPWVCTSIVGRSAVGVLESRRGEDTKGGQCL